MGGHHLGVGLQGGDVPCHCLGLGLGGPLHFQLRRRLLPLLPAEVRRAGAQLARGRAVRPSSPLLLLLLLAVQQLALQQRQLCSQLSAAGQEGGEGRGGRGAR